MLRVEMLPANYGDCLWIEYGDAGPMHRILIDGGLAGTYAAISRKIGDCGESCHVELMIISHVDADHIEGVAGDEPRRRIAGAPYRVEQRAGANRVTDTAGSATIEDPFETLVRSHVTIGYLASEGLLAPG